MGATYGLGGAVVGSLIGKLGGLYVMFLIPFIDIGLAQNPMFDAAPLPWAAWMPGYGAIRVLIDGAFTSSFDEGFGVLLAIIWLIGISAVAILIFRRLAAAKRA